MRLNQPFLTVFITESHVTLSGPFHKNLKNILSIPFMISIGLWIVEDTCKNLGIRKVLTIVTHPNNDKALIFPIFITF